MDRPQRLARRQEIKSAEFYGAQLTPASGSRDSKGDAYTTGDEYLSGELFEFKHTERQSFGLRFRDFWRHRQAALLSGRRPVWEIEYTSPAGMHPHYLVVLDRNDYLNMRDELARLWSKIQADC